MISFDSCRQTLTIGLREEGEEGKGSQVSARPREVYIGWGLPLAGQEAACQSAGGIWRGGPAASWARTTADSSKIHTKVRSSPPYDHLASPPPIHYGVHYLCMNLYLLYACSGSVECKYTLSLDI